MTVQKKDVQMIVTVTEVVLIIHVYVNQVLLELTAQFIYAKKIVTIEEYV